MIVADASVAISALLNDGAARRALAAEQTHAPHLIDPEVAHVLRRKLASGQLRASQGSAALSTFMRLGLTRHPMHPLLGRVWELRENLSAYDACYVSLAEALDCALLTTDARLSRAPGIACAITVVPR